MTSGRLWKVAGLVVSAVVVSASPVRADAVTYWNNIAQPAIAAGRPGPVGTLDSALVQAAVYDAVQSIEKKYKAYHIRIKGASGSSAAAAAAAAHGVLVGLYPSQANAPQTPPLTALNPALTAYLTDNGLLGDPGIEVGEQVAAAFLLLYRAAPTVPAFRGCEDSLPCNPGEWRPTPNHIGNPVPPPAPMFAPWLGGIEPFTLVSGEQFRAAPPPSVTSRKYARHYNEVKALGSFTNAPCQDCGQFEGVNRTAAQTHQAYFWSENFLAQWNRALRTIADAHIHHIAKTARLFALANLAAADAAITAWESKLHFNYWRPVTAVQEGDLDGNLRTLGDVNWQSLINTPPYPDYTSGANNLTGAFTRTLALFFGRDRFNFIVTSNAPQLTDPATRTRTFRRFSEAAQEVVEARILLGIHFRFADTAARRQGQQVAEWAFKHFLRPVRHHDDDDCDDDDHDHDRH